MNIALVQKCPSKTDYDRHFGLPIAKVFNLCSKPVSKVLKKDVDLEGFDPNDYDYVILIGSEAVKEFTKITAVTSYTGRLIPESDSKCGYKGFIASISPAVLAFKPENKPVFEATVKDIKNIIDGKTKTKNDKDYTYITDTLRAVIALNEALTSGATVIALDSETSSLEPREGYMLGISMSYKAHHGVYIDADVLDEKCLQLLQEIIDTREVVFHNAKFDMKYFTYHLDIQFDHREGFVHDTMIMHYLLDERPGTHGLKPLAMKYTDLGDYDKELDEWKKAYCKANGLKAEDFSYDLIPWDIIKVYAVKDTDATIQLFNKFYPILCNAERLIFCYEQLQLPLMHFLKNMEDSGVPVSKPRLELANKELDSQIAMLKDELWATPQIQEFEANTGKIFNPNSPQQVRVLLFDILKLPIPDKRTGTGAISTDATVLLDLAELHRVPELILEIKKMSKLKNTYINKLLPVINGDGKVRTGFHQITTTSGRLSSSGRFNMQQLPRDNPIIKGCVVAPRGYKIVACDLTTAEIYFAAVLSKDKNMQQIFINMHKDPSKYPDFHSTVAHMVFNLSCEPREVKKLYPALRQAAKAISFGILYGSGPAKVMESVNLAYAEEHQPQTCTVELAKGYINDYFKKFKQLKRWIDSCHNQIKQHGFIYNHFGRKRRLLNIHSADKGVAAGEVRSGFNAIIQSISSDSLCLGAIDAAKELKEKELDATIFALVHDSVVAIVREDLVDDYLEIVVRNIQKDRGCSIPGVPVGVEQDSEPGGSLDYSCGKLQKMYPELAEVA